MANVHTSTSAAIISPSAKLHTSAMPNPVATVEWSKENRRRHFSFADACVAPVLFAFFDSLLTARLLPAACCDAACCCDDGLYGSAAASTMFVDELGLDPVETSCVLRKLILKVQDGVPYDNFRHALRAEHDWAIVAETLYGCCCRSRSGAAPPCCSAPSNHKLLCRVRRRAGR